MPLIIVGGIWSGIFTPTESAAVAVVYGVIVSLAFYKDITVRDLPRLLVNAFQTSATVMLVIGATGALAWLITVEQVAVQMATWIKFVASEPWMFLLLVNVILLLLGIFIEPLPALLLTAPLLLPLAQTFNIDLVHLGVVDDRQPRHRAVHAAGRWYAVRRGEARRRGHRRDHEGAVAAADRRDRRAVHHHLRAVDDDGRLAAHELRLTMLLGCIADDLTGATDLGVNLAREGLSVIQVNGVPVAGPRRCRPRTRSSSRSSRARSRAADAVAQSLAALAWLRARGAHRIYFKYCSTFDSTAAGQHRSGDRGAAATRWARGIVPRDARVSAQPAHRLSRPPVRRRRCCCRTPACATIR